MSYQFVTEPNLYSDSYPNSDSSVESAMDAEMTTEQQPPQQNQEQPPQQTQQQAPQPAPTFDSALKNDNGVATIDITYTDAHRSCVSKKPTPLDLGVTQMTAASTEPASKEWKDLRAEELRFVEAKLDAFGVELHEEMD
jgi:pyruvate carboxylase